MKYIYIRSCFYNILLLLIFISTYSFSQNTTVIISDEEDNLSLRGSVYEVFVDSSRNVDFKNILAPQFRDKFTSHNSSHAPRIENPNYAYWYRFSIKSEKPLKKRYLLENLDLHIDNYELYKEVGNILEPVGVVGFSHPFGVRDFEHKNFIFDLPIDTVANVYYIRLTSHLQNPLLLKIRSLQYFAYYSLNEYYLLGMFYGIILIFAIYNLFIYFSLKEKIYFQYFLYALSCIFICLSEDGIGFQYLWRDYDWINKVVEALAPAFLLLTFFTYSKSFLQLKNNYPIGNKILNYSVYVYFIFYFADLLFFNFKNDIPFPLYFIPFTIIYFTAFKIYSKGINYVRYFLIAYSFMFVGIILLILRMHGIVIWKGLLSVYSFNIGVVFEVMILSFAMGDRFSLLKRDKEIAQENTIQQLKQNQELKDDLNKKLEISVEQRTRELIEKNKELEDTYSKLEQQANEISRMNKLLNKENEVLQTNVKELTKARVMLQEVDLKDFGQIFPDKESCLKYLAELKWKSGFVCKKCSNEKFYELNDNFSRRCTKCGYLESATAYTIFHKLKFPITKAFYMLFLIYANKNKITSQELSEILDLRQSTCWSFSKKISANISKWDKKKLPANEDGWGKLVLNPDEV